MGTGTTSAQLIVDGAGLGRELVDPHPPFFYVLSAALDRLLGGAGKGTIARIGRLSGLLGLGPSSCGSYVHGRAPGDARRGQLAAALLLFLPVHVSEHDAEREILVTALISANRPRAELGRPAAGARLLRPALLGAWPPRLLRKLAPCCRSRPRRDPLRRGPQRRGAGAALDQPSAVRPRCWAAVLSAISSSGFLYPHGLGPP
jgi:hypothetical protein